MPIVRPAVFVVKSKPATLKDTPLTFEHVTHNMGAIPRVAPPKK